MPRSPSAHRCPDCGETDASMFGKDKARVSGLSSYCKLCRNRRWKDSSAREDKIRQMRERKLKYNYGITIDQYDTILAGQEGTCAICSGTNEDGRRLAVDHCHDTGKVRGLLCKTCNIGIGHLQDSKWLVHRASMYLEYA